MATATKAEPTFRVHVESEDVERGEGHAVAKFIEAMCPATRTTIAGPGGAPMKLLPYQHEALGRIFARRPDGRRRFRQAVLGVPRKNGKSGLASGVALFGLMTSGSGAQVISAAADKEQARIVFGEARRMVEQSPALAKRLRLFRDAIEDPITTSHYKVISSEAFTKEGLNPNLILYDELHAAPNRELYDVLALAMGARRDPLMYITSTAGVRTDSSGEPSVMYQLFNHLKAVCAGEIDDPSFYGEWWSDDGPIGDDEADARANPAYDLLVDGEDFRSVRLRTPESEYLTKRRNLFVSTTAHWFPEGVFESLAGDVPLDGPLVLGFDGSWTQDTTALVAATVEPEPKLAVIEVWARPRDAEPTWTVPTAEVVQKIRETCGEHQVVEISCDPAYWRTQLEALRGEGFPVATFNQRSHDMTEATSGFQQAVVDGRLVHDGDPRLELHVRNCHVVPASGGIKVQKDKANRDAKIDAAVAGIMARHRAAFYADEPAKPAGVFIA